MVRSPTAADVAIFETAGEFRAWLEDHHGTSSELWVGYYKKGVARASLTYPASVEEALCFGWIDGITHRIDDEEYATRFTPRTKRSTWSAVNVAKMKRLIRDGRVHPAGVRAFEARTAANTGLYSYENSPADLPKELHARLAAKERALSWWQAQSAGYRRGATWWVVSAKREATRERRLEQLIADSAAGRMIKPYRYGRPEDPESR